MWKISIMAPLGHMYLSQFYFWTLMTSAYIMTSTLVMSEYSIDDGNNNNNLKNNEDVTEGYDVTIFKHFNEPYDQRSYGKLTIDVLKSTTSSIRVQWSLTNLTFTDSEAESMVICETFNGKIVSDKMQAHSNSFEFQFLHSNTKYIICVYMLEKSKSSNVSVLHYDCQQFSTIPVVRSDSIVGVILTLGYLFLMGGIGYVTWYRRTQKLRKSEEEEEINIEEEEEEIETVTYPPAGKSGSSGGGGGGGILNCAADTTADGSDDMNGQVTSKGKGRVDCAGACVRFSAVEEEPPIEYNPKKREISF